MEIKKNKEYLLLQKQAEDARKGFKEASDKLRKGYFYEVDLKVQQIEYNTKKGFLGIANKEIRDSLIDFKFHYDPFHLLITAKVKNMEILGLYYDLGYLVSQFPKEKQTHDFLKATIKDYKETLARMENKLAEFGLHPSARPGKNREIEKFLDENNVFGFVPEFYK